MVSSLSISLMLRQRRLPCCRKTSVRHMTFAIPLLRETSAHRISPFAKRRGHQQSIVHNSPARSMYDRTPFQGFQELPHLHADLVEPIIVWIPRCSEAAAMCHNGFQGESTAVFAVAKPPRCPEPCAAQASRSTSLKYVLSAACTLIVCTSTKTSALRWPGSACTACPAQTGLCLQHPAR